MFEPERVVCVYYCRTYYKAVRVGEEESGGHVLRETTSRGQCELVCPSRTCELVCPSRTNERGGEGYCVKEGEGEEGERERERAGEVRLYYSLGYSRLIRNADAFAATRPTLLFRPM